MGEFDLVLAPLPKVPEAFLRTLQKGIAALEWDEFEELACAIFEGLGYDVNFTPGTDDQGIDLVLNDKKAGALDVAQCKHWKDQIGSPVVRDFFGAMIHFQARKGYLISTAGLTESGKAFATGKPIVLWGPDELIQQILIGKCFTGTSIAVTLDQFCARIRRLSDEDLFGKGLPELNNTLRDLDDFSRYLRNPH